MSRLAVVAGVVFTFSLTLYAAQGTPAQPAQGSQQAPQGAQGQGRQGGGTQDVIGGVGIPQDPQPARGQGQGAGGRQGGGRGRQAGPPPGPAPRDGNGRAMLWGRTPTDKGVWLPTIGITAPIATYATIPFQPWAKALYDFRQTNELEPHTRCKPSGFSRQFETPYGVEFVNMPDVQRMYIFDIGGPHTFRTIYMDGRTHPAKVDHGQGFYGHSVGWWEGDTLVVDTVGYNEAFWLDRRGLPHTDKMHTVERFTRVDQATIRYEAEVDDPGAYTQPWKGGFNLRWETGTELFEYVCQQANYATELMLGDYQSVDRTSQYIP
jgi:hypothetical protein